MIAAYEIPATGPATTIEAHSNVFDVLNFRSLVSTFDAEKTHSIALAERRGTTLDGAVKAAHNNEICVYRDPSPEALI